MMKKNILKYSGFLVVGIIIFLLGFSSGIFYQKNNPEGGICSFGGLSEKLSTSSDSSDETLLKVNEEVTGIKVKNNEISIKNNTLVTKKANETETNNHSISKEFSIGEATMVVDFGNGATQKFENLNIGEDGKVIDLLNQIPETSLQREFKDYGGSMGVFIVSLGGIKADKSGEKWWQFWINGEYAKMGISNQKVSDGDLVEIKFTKGER